MAKKKSPCKFILIKSGEELNFDQARDFLFKNYDFNTKTLKSESYAVKVEEPGQVPVQPEAGISREMAEGAPQAKPEVTAEKGKVEEKVAAPLRDVESTAKALEGVAMGSPQKIIEAAKSIDKIEYVEEQEARDIIESYTHYKSGNKKSPATRWAGWFQSVNAANKKFIVDDIQNDPKLRNAMLSLFYDVYKAEFNFKGTFDDFLNAEITLYRGITLADKKGVGQEGFSAFSTTKNRVMPYADEQALGKGQIKEIKIKPKDTYGAVNYIGGGEVEVLVPTDFKKETLKDDFNRLVELNIGLFNEEQLNYIEKLYDKEDYISGIAFAKSVISSNPKQISEAYHADKAAGKETELTKAVEELLTPTEYEKPESKRRPESSGDRGRREESGRFAPLEGAPSVPGINGPDPQLVAVAEQYARDNGINLKRQGEYVRINVNRAKRIADAYEKMKHDPNNPKVKEAYQNLIKQTIAQYEALVKAGYKFWFMDTNIPGNVEYADSPYNALRDLRQNKQMGVFPTTDGYGTGDFDSSDNPLLIETKYKWPVGGLDGELKPVLANDLFRAVHDAFGHGLEGAGFRARGEENAWQAHIRLFTGSAKGAITSETRGQNSWLNYGPHGEKNRTAKTEETIFSDQKTGLMPEWTWKEGIAPDFKEKTITEYETKKEDVQPMLEGVRGVRPEEKGREVSPRVRAEEEAKREEEVKIEQEKTKAIESANKLADNILKLQIKAPGAQSNIFGIPIFIYNQAIKTISEAIRKGLTLKAAIDSAIKKHNLNKQKDFNRDEFIKSLEDATELKYEEVAKAPAKPSKARTEIQKQIEKETGASRRKPTEQKRIDTAASIGEGLGILAGEIDGIKKGIKEGKVRQQQAVSLLTGLINDLIKKDFISQKTFTALNNKLGKVKEGTLSMDKAIAYIEKVADDATYVEKLSEAKSVQKKVKEKAKSDKNFAAQKDIAKAIGRINVNELDNLYDFTALAKNYLNSMLPVTNPNYAPFNEQQALDLLEKIQKQIDDNFIKRIEESTGVTGLTVDDAKLLANALEAENFDVFADNLSEAKKKQLNDIALRQAEYSQMGLDEKIKEDRDYYDGLSKREKTYIDTIKDSDLSKVETKDLIDYIRTVDNIISNNSISNAGNVASALNAQKNITPLTQATKNAKFFNLNNIQKAWQTVPVLLKSIYGSTDIVSKFRNYTGFDAVFTGGSKTNVTFERKYREWVDFKKKNKIKDTAFDIQQRGVYAYLIQNYGGSDVNTDFELNKQKLVQSIEAYKNSGQKELVKLAEVLQGIYDTDVLPFDNVNDFKSNFDAKYPDQKKAWEFFNKTFESIKDNLRVITEAYENESWEDVNNYTPISYRTVDPQMQKEEAAEGGMTFAERYPNKPKQSPTSIKRVKMRNLPKGRAISFDFDGNMFNKYKKAIYDINTIDGKNLFRNIYNNPEFANVVGGVENKLALKSIYNASEKLQAGASVENDISGQILKNVSQGVRNIGVTFSLGGFTQYIKQYPPVALRTMLSLGKNAPLFFEVQNVPLNIELLSEATIQARGSRQGGLDLGEKERNIILRATNSALNKYAQGFENFTEKTRNLFTLSLTQGDQRVAKRAWMAHYMDYLKRNGVDIKVSDLETEHTRLDKIRKEAISYAQQKVDEQQVPSNAALLSDLQKQNGNAFKDFFRNIFLPFNTFSGNVRGRMIEDVKFIRYGNKEQRTEALKDLINNTIEITAFQTISKFMLYAMVKYPLSELLDYMFDLEDEKDKEEFWNGLKKQYEYYKTQIAKDIFVGGLGGFAENMFIYGINLAAYFATESDEEKKQSFEQWSEDNSILKNYPAKDKWYDQLGGYGIAFREYSTYLGNAEAAVTGYYKDEYSYQKYLTSMTEQNITFDIKGYKKLSENEQSFMTFLSITNLFSLAGMRDADIANALNAKKREILRRREVVMKNPKFDETSRAFDKYLKDNNYKSLTNEQQRKVNKMIQKNLERKSPNSVQAQIEVMIRSVNPERK